MDVIIINGARNRTGRTAQAAAALAAGLAAEGASCEAVFLPELNLERCRQCDEDGWGQCRSEGSCIIEDDFAKLVGQIRNAAAVVLATPVYYSDLSESMRAFTDRLRRICTFSEESRRQIEGKPVVCIGMAGGGGGGSAACLGTFERLAGNCRFELLDLISVRRQNLDLKLEVLEATGRWLARQIPHEARLAPPPSEV